MMNFGGAIASILISIIFPLLFNNNYEYPLIFLLLIIICFLLIHKSDKIKFSSFIYKFSFVLIGVNLVLTFNIFKKMSLEESYRGFFGTLSINQKYWKNEKNPNQFLVRSLAHGSISHGHEIINYPNSGKTSYYSDYSGIGIVINFYKERSKKIDVGVIGLGAGMIASNNRNDDKMTFYEIDPLVIDLAKNKFSYIKDASGEVKLKLGDARLVLSNLHEKHDLLIVDAFSDDSIPAHLLTKQAMKIYKNNISDEGSVLFHISNRYLNLEKILIPLCDVNSFKCFLSDNKGQKDKLIHNSLWFIMTKNNDLENYLKNINIDDSNIKIVNNYNYSKKYWTDDYNAVLPLLKIFN